MNIMDSNKQVRHKIMWSSCASTNLRVSFISSSIELHSNNKKAEKKKKVRDGVSIQRVMNLSLNLTKNLRGFGSSYSNCLGITQTISSIGDLNPNNNSHPCRRRNCLRVSEGMTDKTSEKIPGKDEEEKKGKDLNPSPPLPPPQPLPTPPEKPLPGDCCGSGCVRCVWDIYYEELEDYNNLLQTQSQSKP